jgi:uncharacterized protein (TIGR02118 family)
MIRVSMMYPVTEGATFDLDYYRTTHMGKIVKETPGVIRYEIDEALNGPYSMIGQIYFESAEALQAAMDAPTAEAAWADVPNFTNLQPVMQVSRILD